MSGDIFGFEFNWWKRIVKICPGDRALNELEIGQQAAIENLLDVLWIQSPANKNQFLVANFRGGAVMTIPSHGS